MFWPLLEANIFKITKNILIWILVQTVFFLHAKFEHDMITEKRVLYIYLI